MVGKEKPGTWRVMRNCCTSGNCVECTGKSRFGVPLRVVHMDGISFNRAKVIAAKWAAYDAKAEPMPKPEPNLASGSAELV